MSMTGRWMRAAWRPIAPLALVLGLTAPAWSAADVSAQATLPAIAEAVPESTVVFHTTDLDRDGTQWQQTEDLLARVGLPDALDLWEQAILEDGEQSGDITRAELDALLGGEMAIAMQPEAVEHIAAMAMMHGSGTMVHSADATPMAGTEDQPLGVAAILRPGDVDASWAYVQRQFADLAAEKQVSVEESSYGDAEILSIPAGERPEHSGMDHEGAMDDMDDMDKWMSGHDMYGHGGIVAARAGEFIVASMTTGDIEPIVDAIDGTAASLADSAEAQAVAADLPPEALSFTYIDGQGILDVLDPEMIAVLQNSMPGMPVEALASQWGLAISADVPGFRFDTITILNDTVDLDAMTVENDPNVASAAERAPAGTFAFQAGRLPENVYLGAPFMLAQAVNAAESGEDWAGDESAMAPPTEEEMEAEIATAAATLDFDPRADLFDILGHEFIAFASFPSLSFEDFGIDAVAAVSTDDPDALAETARKMAAWIDRSDEGADVSVRRVGEESVYAVSDGEMEGALALEFGVVADQAVVGFGGGIDSLNSEPADSLADDAQFQTVMDFLPGEYYQVAYVDIGQAIDPVMNLIGMLGAMGEFGTPDAATPATSGGEPQNIRALGAVNFQEGNVTGSSALLYIDG